MLYLHLVRWDEHCVFSLGLFLSLKCSVCMTPSFMWTRVSLSYHSVSQINFINFPSWEWILYSFSLVLHTYDSHENSFSLVKINLWTPQMSNIAYIVLTELSFQHFSILFVGTLIENLFCAVFSHSNHSSGLNLSLE